MHTPHQFRDGSLFTRASRRPANGFTLLELMVVIALIGIGAAIILPEMKGTYGDVLLRAASRELIDAITLANSQAVTLNRTHRFRLAYQGQYSVEKSVGRRGSETIFAPVKDLTGASGRFDERIHVELRKSNGQPDLPPSDETAPRAETDDRSPWVLFYPDGTADQVEIRLTDSAGTTLTLRLNPITARLEVLEPDQP